MRREKEFLRTYANHTMLIPPPTTQHLMMFKISASGDPICSDQIPKIQPRASTVNLSYCLFKILKFSGHLFQAWCHPPIQFTQTVVQSCFLPGALLWQMMIVISFLCRRKTALSDYASEVRDPSSSKPNQSK